MDSGRLINMAFLTEKEWENNEKYDGSDPILKWRDVPEKTIFCVVSIEHKITTNQKFDTYVLHFTDKDDNSYKVFCPSHFIKTIRKNRKQNERPYFCSHGLIRRNNNSIASFEISYKKEDKMWDIFDKTDE